MECIIHYSMTNKERYIEEITNGFQKNRGKGSCYCFAPLDPSYLIATIIYKYWIKHQEDEIFIITPDYTYFGRIKFIINKIYPENTFKLKFCTKDYINFKYHYTYNLVITLGIESFEILNKINNESKFTIAIFTETIVNQSLIQAIRNILPNISTNVSSNDIISELIYKPVREYRIPVNLYDNDRESYDKYEKILIEYVKIFGDIYNVEKCKKGDIENNISASEFRYNLAINNGWNEQLDTNIEIFKKIDDIYNPNNLYEKAVNFYDLVRNRTELVVNNEAKLKEILNICNQHNDKRILILSKSGEFAKTITEYITNNSDLKCIDFHDCIEDSMAYDEYGDVITYKSGANKGKPRIFKAQAVANCNLYDFNNNKYNILSAKYNGYKLDTNVDIMIITDGIYTNVTKIRERNNLLKFNEETTDVYRLYCKNTIEDRKLHSQIYTRNIEIIEDITTEEVYCEENVEMIL